MSAVGPLAAVDAPEDGVAARRGVWVLTLPQLWLFLAVALPVVGALLASISTVDLAYGLRAGSQIQDGGGIPSTDTFTYTIAGAPWQDQQWGAQLLLAAVYRIGGWGWLFVLRAALVGLTFGLVLLTARRAGAGERDAALLTIGAFLVSISALALRPQLLGIALFALVVFLVGERHRHPRLLWAVPVVTLVWANLHGSFFLGPAAVGAAWLADLEGHRPEYRRTLLVALVSALAACVTPFGPWVYAYALGISTDSSITQRVTEWQPTTLHSVPGLVFYLSAMGVAGFLARRGRTPWSALAWLGGLFALGAYAIRGLAWWPIGAAATVAGLLGADAAAPSSAPAPRPTPAGLGRLNLLIAGLVVAAGVVLLPFWRPTDPLTGPAGVLADAPGGITKSVLASSPSGARLFLPQEWGSWFELQTPDRPVFVDSRIELFPSAVWDDYDAIVGGATGWQQTLGRWGVSVVVVAKDQPDAFRARMAALPGWHQAYADADGWVFVRG